MGTLFSLHKDIVRKIYREYLSNPDRLLLCYAVNVKKRLEPSYYSYYYTKKGYIEILKWLKEIGYKFGVCDTSIAAFHGHIDILKWLKEINCTFSLGVCENAAANSKFETLQWLKENGYAR